MNLFFSILTAIREMQFLSAFCDLDAVKPAVFGGDLVQETEAEVIPAKVPDYVLDDVESTVENCSKFVDKDAWKLLKQTCKY